MDLTNDLPVSPVTGNACVRIVDTFVVPDIIRLYLEQENADVSDYLGHNKIIYLMECGDTGYRFYFPYEIAGDEAFYQKLASEKATKGIDYDRDWSPDHDFALEAIGPGEKVLEIGCNTGKFLEGAKKKTGNVSGLEFNPVAVETARKNGLDVQNLDIAQLAEIEPEGYDVVCAFQVLEHITSVKSFIENCLKVLKPGGKLIFSVPNNEPFYQRFSKYEVLNMPPHHMGLWDLAAFKKLSGFFPVELAGFDYSGLSSFVVTTYLRAKFKAGVVNLLKDHTFSQEIKIWVFSPLAALQNFLDLLSGKKNYAYLTVVFVKK